MRAKEICELSLSYEITCTLIIKNFTPFVEKITQLWMSIVYRYYYFAQEDGVACYKT